MKRFKNLTTSLGLCLAFAGFVVVTSSYAPRAWGEDGLTKQATWQQPTAAEVRATLSALLTEMKADELTLAKVDALWPVEGNPPAGLPLLDLYCTTLAAIDPEVQPLLDLVAAPRSAFTVPVFTMLTDENKPAAMRLNLRLLMGRWLAQQGMVDEATAMLAGIEPEQVVDPASLLFFRAVAHHRLLEKDPCLADVSKLLENETSLPRRYVQLAKLMQADLAPLKPDSLDEIARMMDDIGRRLDLGRAGKKVRDEEIEVVEKLEKMIEELEKQRQQQQASAGSPGSSPSPSSPMQDSQAAELKGPGEVDPKEIGKRDGWGNLPPKDRQEVLQQIGRELPAHFRETIEEYFKRLAQDGVK